MYLLYLNYLNLSSHYFKRKSTYIETQISGRYSTPYWIRAILNSNKDSISIKTSTDIIFRKNLILGSNYTHLYKLGSPFRIFFHPRIDLQAFHYRNRKLGDFTVKFELLVSGGKFCAGIYFVDGNLSITDIKNALQLKYLTVVNLNDTLEKWKITDSKNNQLFVFKADFHQVIVYVVEGFFENVHIHLTEEIAKRKRAILGDKIIKLMNQL